MMQRRIERNKANRAKKPGSNIVRPVKNEVHEYKDYTGRRGRPRYTTVMAAIENLEVRLMRIEKAVDKFRNVDGVPIEHRVEDMAAQIKGLNEVARSVQDYQIATGTFVDAIGTEISRVWVDVGIHETRIRELDGSVRSVEINVKK